MQFDDLESRKALTFAQAEGIAPLPSQMSRTTVTKTLRAQVHDLLRTFLRGMSQHNGRFFENFGSIFADCHVKYLGLYSDDFDENSYRVEADQLKILKKGDYTEFYGYLQFLIRHHAMPAAFSIALNQVLEEERAAFRIVDGDTFMAVASEEEIAAVESALETTRREKFLGAHRHLKLSAERLGEGKFADSVRESIHSVEAVARTLEPSAKLSKALARLEAKINLHGAMKDGFNSIYGYTSDEGGIRHPLLDGEGAKVDEADAIFMIGACASFVTYLISKKRLAQLEDAPQD